MQRREGQEDTKVKMFITLVQNLNNLVDGGTKTYERLTLLLYTSRTRTRFDHETRFDLDA